jgi:large subunit ribosomal protein L25
MSDQLTLPAEARDRAGKGASRALRRDGRVPAVVYGEKKEPLSIHVEEKLLIKMLSTGHFMNSVVMVDYEGKAHRTLPKAVDFHPVSSRPIHVDFLRIGEHTKVHVAVPVRFDNDEESPGLKRGGVLNVVRHEIEVTCPAEAIPDYFEFNLEGLEIGRSVHISAIKLPDGVTTTIQNRDFTVATIAGHKIEEEPTPGAEVAAVEGEVPVEGAEGAAPAEGAADAKAAPGKEGAAAKAPAGKEAAKPAAAAKPADKGKK